MLRKQVQCTLFWEKLVTFLHGNEGKKPWLMGINLYFMIDGWHHSFFNSVHLDLQNHIGSLGHSELNNFKNMSHQIAISMHNNVQCT